jgi:hypothetical protein
MIISNIIYQKIKPVYKKTRDRCLSEFFGWGFVIKTRQEYSELIPKTGKNCEGAIIWVGLAVLNWPSTRGKSAGKNSGYAPILTCAGLLCGRPLTGSAN